MPTRRRSAKAPKALYTSLRDDGNDISPYDTSSTAYLTKVVGDAMLEAAVS